ncbi:alpha-hydroxy acid oxidase [Marinospirillum insulare]|uniref:Alpha-hydroxy-acid oxidizing enzyme n=1 Tax=Marinospirillum insulare TaxID=217169 RepID=A0ABQ5ZZJ0_9GAMM|nr:alpha-hydroxy acid oxidase [Marinospirillum insulare]GLR64440.1 alpha-hydroxy-acid oxidizing enzyme [Marinospirillum insulare]
MLRRLYSGSNLDRAQSLYDLRARAVKKLPNFCREYLEGGGDDELTLSRNRQSFNDILFRPRMLVDISQRDLSTQIFDQRIAMPLAIAPTGFNGLLSHEGDLKLALAAKKAGIPFIQSLVSTVSLERIAATGVRHWMQLYLFQNRENFKGVIERAKKAGCEALVLTVDTSVLGNRTWDRRNYRAPMQLNLRNLIHLATRPAWVWDILVPKGMPKFTNLGDSLPPNQASAKNAASFLTKEMDASLNWQDVRWLRENWQGKLILKGLLTSEDALQAKALGVDGIVISNHGGRQLDSAPSAIDVLPEIRQAVGQDFLLIVDGGLRRGSDLIKALCLGANLVLSGRATLYGLAAGGQAGADKALEIIQTEADRTLGLLGCTEINQLGKEYLL